MTTNEDYRPGGLPYPINYDKTAKKQIAYEMYEAECIRWCVLKKSNEPLRKYTACEWERGGKDGTCIIYEESEIFDAGDDANKYVVCWIFGKNFMICL